MIISSLGILGLANGIKDNNSIVGSKWCTEVQGFSSDTLTFKANNEVEYFMSELNWVFDSNYELVGDTVIIKTITIDFEVDDISEFKPDLIQKYLLKSNTMKLFYLANYRNNKWVEAESDRYDSINDFVRVK